MKSIKILILCITCFIFICSCEKEDITPPVTTTEIETPINFTEIGKGALKGNGLEEITQSNMIITNNTDWQNLINQMNSVNNESDGFSETNIDFNSYQIIAVFKEIKPTNWEVEMSSIIENDDNITVSVTETEHGFTVITQPFHIVKIPITSKPIVFN